MCSCAHTAAAYEVRQLIMFLPSPCYFHRPPFHDKREWKGKLRNSLGRSQSIVGGQHGECGSAAYIGPSHKRNVEIFTVTLSSGAQYKVGLNFYDEDLIFINLKILTIADSARKCNN